jgi:hypothetical protein
VQTGMCFVCVLECVVLRVQDRIMSCVQVSVLELVLVCGDFCVNICYVDCVQDRVLDRVQIGKPK